MRKAGVWLWIVAALAVLIALASLRYALTGAGGAPPNVAQNRFGGLALMMHIGAATVALALGPWQFFPGIRARWPRWHRRLGTTYVIACFVGGAAGLVLAAGTSAGPIGMAGFGLLAVAWLGCTFFAWRLAVARDFAHHQQWMTRSFALTFAAVTLRLYLPLAILSHLDMDASYRVISWLCWVPNLVVAELWLRRRNLLHPARRATTA